MEPPAFSKIFGVSMCAVVILAGCSVSSAPAPYNYYHLAWTVKNSQAILDKLDHGENGSTSFQRLVDRANELAADQSAPLEEVSRLVLDLIEWQYFFTPSTEHIPPIPLIESGDAIVPPPPGIHNFYKKYLNVYEDDYTLGIPIIASDLVPDAALYKVKESMEVLLGKTPAIREAMVMNNIRVALRADDEQNRDHPGEIGPGGARPGRPTTYIEEEGVAWRDETGEIHEGFKRLNRHVAVEEFGHSIHRSGLPFIDPDHDIIKEINDAFVYAVSNDIYVPPQYLDGPPLSNPSMKAELNKVISELRDGEYFAVALDLFYGVLHENSEWKLKTREELAEKNPQLYEIITRYFPTIDWSPYDP